MQNHRPSATHYNKDVIVEGEQILAAFHDVRELEINLDSWGPANTLLLMAMYVDTTWGEDAPKWEEYLIEEEVQAFKRANISPLANDGHPPSLIRWAQLNEYAQERVDHLLSGKTLGQTKELLSIAFTVGGVTRASTHQITRTRLGAFFMQHGGRDNDWRQRTVRLPHTFTNVNNETFNQIVEVLMASRELYAALVDQGVPWQDARYVLPIGTTTFLRTVYNLQSITGLLGNRLCHCMMWETNYIAQRMLAEIKAKMPYPFAKYLGAWCDKTGVCGYNGDLFPPCQKYPKPYDPKDYHHKKGANPFVVLKQDGSAHITDGEYPHDVADTLAFNPEYYGHKPQQPNG